MRMPAGKPSPAVLLGGAMHPPAHLPSFPPLRLLLAAGLLTGGLVAATGTAAHAATCTGVNFVDARGTGEPGTLGWIVGDPVYAALQSKIPGRTWSAYAVN